MMSTAVLQLRLLDGLPDQRRRSSVRADEVEGDRRVPVLVELRPVESDENLLPTRKDKRDPLREPVSDLDPRVAQKPVDLLHRVLWVEVERMGKPSPDRLDLQSRGVQYADDAVRQRHHPRHVHVFTEQLRHERVSVFLSRSLRGRRPHPPCSLSRPAPRCRETSLLNRRLPPPRASLCHGRAVTAQDRHANNYVHCATNKPGNGQRRAATSRTATSASHPARGTCAANGEFTRADSGDDWKAAPASLERFRRVVTRCCPRQTRPCRRSLRSEVESTRACPSPTGGFRSGAQLPP